MAIGIFGIVLLILIVGGLFLVGEGSLGGVFMNLNNNLKELIENNVIDEAQADKIKSYYKAKKENSNLGLIILSIVGVILISLGFILVVAHNWHTIPKFVKLSLSILILLIAQGIFLYNIYKKKTSLFAREGSSLFLTFMIAATIALISQIYNIEGNFTDFLFTWMLLVLPIPYLYNSAVTGIIYTIGISMWFAEGLYRANEIEIYRNLLMLIFIMPFTFNFIKKHTRTLRAHLMEIIFFICLIIIFAIAINNTSNILPFPLIFNALLVGMYSKATFFKGFKLGLTKTLAQLSLIIQMIILAFDRYYINFDNANIILFNEFPLGNTIAILIFLFALISFYYFVRKKLYEDVIYVILPAIIAISTYSFGGAFFFLVSNLYLIGLAIFLIINSNIEINIYKLNLGLIITLVLVLKWFLDSRVDIIVRAIGFIILGVILILANANLIKRKKEVLKNE